MLLFDNDAVRRFEHALVDSGGLITVGTIGRSDLVTADDQSFRNNATAVELGAVH